MIIICGTYINKSHQPVIPIIAMQEIINRKKYGTAIKSLPKILLKAIKRTIIATPAQYAPTVIGFAIYTKKYFMGLVSPNSTNSQNRIDSLQNMLIQSHPMQLLLSLCCFLFFACETTPVLWIMSGFDLHQVFREERGRIFLRPTLYTRTKEPSFLLQSLYRKSVKRVLRFYTLNY